MRETRILLAGITVILIALVVWWEVRSGGPGPLSPTHAAVPGLGGAEACDRCHREEGGALTGCPECHAPVRVQIGEGRGFHGQLEPGMAGACAPCHVEHRAAEVPLVGDHAFRLAGFAGGRNAYDHRGYELGLTGRHDDLACTGCHSLADADLLPAGARRFSAPGRHCAACHEAEFAAVRDPDHLAHGFPRDCVSCHDQSSFAGAEFRHRFPIDRGEHRGLGCADCHDDAEDGSRFTCTACHDHRRTEMDKEHRKVADYRFASPDCLRCHPAGEKK